MKRIIAFSLFVAIVAFEFAACSTTSSTSTTAAPTKKTDHTGGSQGAGDLSTRGARGPQ